MDMGKHTASRVPIPHVTPEKTQDGLEDIRTGFTPPSGTMKEPMAREQVLALAEGTKKLGAMFESPHKMSLKISELVLHLPQVL